MARRIGWCFLGRAVVRGGVAVGTLFGLSALIVPSAALAGSSIPTFTWSGGGGSANTDWSDPANWQGGIAPTAGSAVDLVFPANPPANSTNETGNEQSNNDITGLVVDALTLNGAATACGASPQWVSVYDITGDAITLEQGVTGSVTKLANWKTTCGTNNELALPIGLGPSAQTWSFDGGESGQNVGIGSWLHISSLSGTSTLTVDERGGAQVDLSGNVGPVSVVGTGEFVSGFGVSGLNSQDGEPVVVDAVAINGTAVGPLTLTNGGWLSRWSGLTHMTIHGNLTFDAPSSRVAQSELSEYLYREPSGSVLPDTASATGAVALGNAQLALVTVCGMQPAAGLRYTLLSGASVTGQLDSGSSPIANGQTIEVPDPFGGNCAPTFVTINYTPTTVTATVVPAHLMIATNSMPQATVFHNYSLALQALGGTPPYSWSIKSGHLPVGLTLSASGVISGTPLVPQEATFTVQVTDASDPTQVADATLTLTVGTGTALDPTVVPLGTNVVNSLTGELCPSLPSVPVACAYVPGT